MPRLMSVALTEQAVVERRKTVTRRLGWYKIKPGDRLQLVRKSMGRRRADGTVDPLVRLALVEVVATEVVRLDGPRLDDVDVAAEGFAGWTPAQFVEMFTTAMRCVAHHPVNRIEWRYLDVCPRCGHRLSLQSIPLALACCPRCGTGYELDTLEMLGGTVVQMAARL